MLNRNLTLTIEVVENLEGYLVEMKQQTTALYVDYANKANEWDDKEKVVCALSVLPSRSLMGLSGNEKRDHISSQ
jgi:hypothetical protein